MSPRFVSRRIHWTLIVANLLGLVLTGFDRLASGAAPNSPDLNRSSEAELVREALHREIYGLTREKSQLLQAALAVNPDYAPAHWQSGRLQWRGQWADVQSLLANGCVDPNPWSEYVRRRQEAADTIADHWQLASWCREQKLSLQEQAHLSRVLDLNPEHAAARTRLGYRRINGNWLSAAEITADESRRNREADASAKWRSELMDIRHDLQYPDDARRSIAQGRLNRIQDPAVIPALESMLSVSSEAAALAVIQSLGMMRGEEAVNSLIRHAVFSNWASVRDAAAEQLRQRKRNSYVPVMLREMYKPVVTRFDVVPLPNGRLGYRHAFEREGQEERQLLVLDTTYTRVRRLTGDGRETLLRAFVDSFAGVTQRETAAAQQNWLQSTANQRLGDALNVATNQHLPADPQVWWQWWDQENDQVRQGDKQLRARQFTQQVAMIDRRTQSAGGGGIQSTGVGQRAECFVAGTQVWTHRGPQAIELIQVGDLVLAQDIDTGELAFKPVVRTTVRPAEKLVVTRVGRDRFQTSRGHLFWGNGDGWMKAGHLAPGTELHGLRGAVPVSDVSAGEAAETFNLAVADYHTYFVGQEQLLTHDVTLAAPTDSVLPGLKEE